MLNSFVRGQKAWRFAVGVCIGLLGAPAFQAQADTATPTFSTLFAFDLHYTAGGVAQGTGENAGYLFGTTYDSSLSYGGSIYKVAIGGGAPQLLYQLQSTDGYSPQATLLSSADGYLYGTTYYGPRVGSNTVAGTGTVFRIKQDGTGYTTLHKFAAPTTTQSVTGNSINTDGIYPSQALIEDGTYLYGVTTYGGNQGSGTVFKVRKSDGQLTPLHNFAATDSTGINANGEGAYPSASLTLGSDGRLYGVTSGGGESLRTTSSGTAGAGTVFSLETDGSDFQTLYKFTALDDTQDVSVNEDGVQPNGQLVEVDSGVFLGTTSDGGDPTSGTVSGYGTVFRLEVADGIGNLNTLYAFDNLTGATPKGNLVYDRSSGLVYGVNTSGSSSSDPVTLLGSIFSIKPDDGYFTIEHPFIFAEASGLTGALMQADNGDLFGTATYGNACTGYSSSGYGGVYRYSIGTGQSSTAYSSCTVSSSSGGGAMSPGILWLLSALGLAPPVRRRLFAR